MTGIVNVAIGEGAVRLVGSTPLPQFTPRTPAVRSPRSRSLLMKQLRGCTAKSSWCQELSLTAWRSPVCPTWRTSTLLEPSGLPAGSRRETTGGNRLAEMASWIDMRQSVLW